MDYDLFLNNATFRILNHFNIDVDFAAVSLFFICYIALTFTITLFVFLKSNDFKSTFLYYFSYIFYCCLLFIIFYFNLTSELFLDTAFRFSNHHIYKNLDYIKLALFGLILIISTFSSFKKNIFSFIMIFIFFNSLLLIMTFMLNIVLSLKCFNTLVYALAVLALISNYLFGKTIKNSFLARFFEKKSTDSLIIKKEQFYASLYAFVMITKITFILHSSYTGNIMLSGIHNLDYYIYFCYILCAISIYKLLATSLSLDLESQSNVSIIPLDYIILYYRFLPKLNLVFRKSFVFNLKNASFFKALFKTVFKPCVSELYKPCVSELYLNFVAFSKLETYAKSLVGFISFISVSLACQNQIEDKYKDKQLGNCCSVLRDSVEDLVKTSPINSSEATHGSKLLALIDLRESQTTLQNKLSVGTDIVVEGKNLFRSLQHCKESVDYKGPIESLDILKKCLTENSISACSAVIENIDKIL